MMTKTWFITGGTPGGFGMAFAEAALEVGDRVVLTARRPDELRVWSEKYGDRVLVVPLDVTDAAQVREAIDAAEEHFGGIDVLVNNAGRGWYGSIEGMDEADVRAMFELNFFGLLSVIRAVLPGMRARGSGWIVNMSSVAGLRGVTGFGFYSAAKFAVEAVTEVLREEVAAQGIRVMAVEPGAFRTQAYAGFADEPIKESIPEYTPMLEQVRTAMIDQNGEPARRSSTWRTRGDRGHEPKPASPTAGPRQRWIRRCDRLHRGESGRHPRERNTLARS